MFVGVVMSERAGLVWERSLELLGRAPTWHELSRALKSEGLDEHLGPSGMQDLLCEWHKKAAHGLSDIQLAEEIAFWGNGGTYAEHLKGFQAVPPAALVDEAINRGWFVKKTPSGRAIVNPPQGRPVTLNLSLGG